MPRARNIRRAAVAGCALALVTLPSAAQPLSALSGGGAVRVGPSTSTTVRGVTDCDESGLGSDCDMTGAVSGSLSYKQRDDGTLVLTVRMQFARASETYGIYLTGGPSHDLATGFQRVGSLTTDGSGAAQRTITVPVSTLRGLGGSGYHTDHVDVGADSVYSFFVAGAVNYLVPGSSTASTTTVRPGDPTRR